VVLSAATLLILPRFFLPAETESSEFIREIPAADKLAPARSPNRIATVAQNPDIRYISAPFHLEWAGISVSRMVLVVTWNFESHENIQCQTR
jgi:hypothetical protein